MRVVPVVAITALSAYQFGYGLWAPSMSRFDMCLKVLMCTFAFAWFLCILIGEAHGRLSYQRMKKLVPWAVIHFLISILVYQNGLAAVHIDRLYAYTNALVYGVSALISAHCLYRAINCIRRGAQDPHEKRTVATVNDD